MRLLLDTHIFLWSLLDQARLTKRVADALEDPSNELWLSPITIWEVIILAEKGRIILKSDPKTWLRTVMNRIPFREALINHEAAIHSRLVDLPHQDLADRFLAATAILYDLRLVTADQRLMGCKELAVMANL